MERHAAKGLLGSLLDKMALSGALEDTLVSSRVRGKGGVRAGDQAEEAPGVLSAEEESGGGARMGGGLQVCGLRTLGRGR